MANPDDGMTPEQTANAWVAMRNGERARAEQLIKDIEGAVNDIVGQMNYLGDCKEWDEGATANHGELEYIQRQLRDSNDARYILARCSELRDVLSRILPPPDDAVI